MGLLVPIRVRSCDVESLLGPIVYIDLVDLDQDQAIKTLLAGIRHDRVKPSASPVFPGKILPLKAVPHFPGIASTLQYIPEPRNNFFTGRTDFLENLRQAFKRPKSRSQKLPIAVSGLPGIGKTQIALEYAYRYQKDYRSTIWLRATSQETLYADFVTVAKLLNLAEKDVKEQDFAVRAVKRWLSERTRWLLILDEVSDPDILREFSFLANKSHVLVTTRNPRIYEAAEKHELEKMKPEEGALFLLRRSDTISLEKQLDVDSEIALLAREISFKLDGLPLALNQAGAYIAQTGCGLNGYLQRYEKLHVELLRYVPQHESMSVARTLTLSFDEVRQAHPIAADLLCLCAFLHPDAIPEEIITGGRADLNRRLGSATANEIGLDKVIAELRKYSLLQRNADDKTLTIHGLVQTILRDGMKKSEQHRWAERTVRAVNRVFPQVGLSTWNLCQRYIHHALACASGSSITTKGNFPKPSRFIKERRQFKSG